MKDSPSNFRRDVLVVGAGPTGLLLAYILASSGVSVRLVDRREGPVRQSRAMVIQARTLEYYDMFGFADRAVALGTRLEDGHLLVEGKERFAFSLRTIGDVHTRFPFVLALPQDEHERLLLSVLSDVGVEPEWGTEVIGLEAREVDALVSLRHRSGRLETYTSRWVVGCDGATSIVRGSLGIGFEGGVSEGNFFVADVVAEPAKRDVYFALGHETVTLMLPVRSSGTQRLIGIVPQKAENKFEAMIPRLQELLRVQIKRTEWFSTYHVHHKVADLYRRHRCFLAGDAAHVHSPVGGQGMNTGLGDAVNLGWKLVAVIQGTASPSVLDSYEAERKPFAQELVQTTDRMFKSMVSQGWLSRQLRMNIAPNILAFVGRFAASKRAVFRLVGQLGIAYRKSPISVGGLGEIRSGDRLPWLRDPDIYRSLDGRSWSAHIFSSEASDATRILESSGIVVHQWPLSREARKSGFEAGTVYLVRPDAYIGFIERDSRVPQLLRYLTTSGFAFRPRS